MADLIETHFPGAVEIQRTEPAPGECDWPTCETTDPLLSLDGARSWWCVEHVLDDCLPGPIVSGPVGYCARCSLHTVEWLGQTPMHRWCLRDWTMGKVTLDRRGAYARRTG